MQSTVALSAQVKEIFERYRVPGLAVSIVKDGTPIYRECLGVTSTATNRTLEPHHSFDIGSISKTFNAAAMGVLVDEGQVQWDTRAIDVLPEFRLSDPTLTPHVTIRDLLGQSVGFGEDSVTNYNSHFSRQEIVDLIRYLPLRAEFRAECAYQQYGPVAAGVIIERLSGMSWEDFIEQRVCAPLGLTSTFSSYFRLPSATVACDPHLDHGDGVMRVIPHRNFDNLAPAGSMVSSLEDMEAWFTAFATGGGGLLRPETVEEMLRPRVPVLRNGIHPQRWASRCEANFVSYGLGFFCHDFAGHLISEHTGVLEGFSVLGCSVASRRLAIIILTNQHLCPAVPILRYLLLAHALQVPQSDWQSRVQQCMESAKGRRFIKGEAYPSRPSERMEKTVPTISIERYAGDYYHSGYGVVPITHRDGCLQANIVGNPCIIEHWHYDTFCAIPIDPAVRSYHPQIFLHFERNMDGYFNRLQIPTIANFERVPALQ